MYKKNKKIKNKINNLSKYYKYQISKISYSIKKIFVKNEYEFI